MKAKAALLAGITAAVLLPAPPAQAHIEICDRRIRAPYVENNRIWGDVTVKCGADNHGLHWVGVTIVIQKMTWNGWKPEAGTPGPAYWDARRKAVNGAASAVMRCPRGRALRRTRAYWTLDGEQGPRRYTQNSIPRISSCK